MTDSGAIKSQGISSTAQNTNTDLAAVGLCRVGWVWPQFQRAAPKYRSSDQRKALATARTRSNEENSTRVPNTIRPATVPGNHRNVKNGTATGSSETALEISTEDTKRLRFKVGRV